jgi:hypothetical protein
MQITSWNTNITTSSPFRGMSPVSSTVLWFRGNVSLTYWNIQRLPHHVHETGDRTHIFKFCHFCVYSMDYTSDKTESCHSSFPSRTEPPPPPHSHLNSIYLFITHFTLSGAVLTMG